MHKLLIIDDNFVELEILVKQFPDLEIHYASNTHIAKKLISLHKFDLIVSDFIGVDILNSETDLSFLPKDRSVVASSSVVPQKTDLPFVQKNDLEDYIIKRLRLTSRKIKKQ